MSDTNVLVAAIAGIAAFFIASQVKKEEKKLPEPHRIIEEDVVYPPQQQGRILSPFPEWTDQYLVDAESHNIRKGGLRRRY